MRSPFFTARRCFWASGFLTPLQTVFLSFTSSWKLLYESRLVPEPIGHEDDRRLPEWGFGITNLVPRPTPGIDTLRAEEYVAGARALRRKIRRVKPEIVA